MALEALRDVFIQAGQNYANRARQDELLAQERARQDEIYTRQRRDTEKDQDRRTKEQIDAEKRAEQRVKDAEQREITNAIDRLTKLGKAEASMVMRRAVYMSGKPGALDPDVMSDAEVMAHYPDALKNKQIQDSVNSMSAEIAAKKQTLQAYKDLTKEQQADQLQTQSRYYETLNERISDVNSRIEELGKSGGVNAERAAATYNSVLESFVNRATGGNKAQFIADNFRNRKNNPPSEIEILMASGYYPAFESEVKNRQALEKANDPEVTKLLAEYQSLMVSRRDTEQKLTALNFDFSKAAPAGKLATAAAPAGTPKTTGTPPAPAALKAAIDAARGGAQTKDKTTPTTPTGDPYLGLDGGDPSLNGGDPTTFFVPPGADAPAAAAAAVAPAPAAAAPAAAAAAAAPAPGEVPAWWSRERDPAANQRAVIEFAKNAPGKVLNPIYDAARALASKVNPNNFVRGSQVPVYDPVTGKEGVDAVYAYDPETAAEIRRMNDERTTTPMEFFTSGDLTRKIGTKLPDITSSGGPTSPNTFFANQDPLLFNQSFSPKPMTFGESFAKRYAEVQNSNLTPREKAESLAAIVRTRDLLVSRGLTYDSPDPVRSSIKRAGSLSGTVYSGPRSEAPGWAQGAATVPPQTFPGFFGPTAR